MRLGFLVVVDAHKEQIVGVFKDLARVLLAFDLRDCSICILVVFWPKIPAAMLFAILENRQPL